MTSVAEPRASRTPRTWVVGTALLIVLVAVIALDWGRHLRIQTAWFDAMQEWHPRQVTTLPATVVEIDDQSLAALGRWPWPRTLLAQLIQEINRQQPAAIGIDIVMAEADPLSHERLLARTAPQSEALAASLAALPSNDHVLADAIADAPVVLAMAGSETASKLAIRVAPVLTRDTSTRSPDAPAAAPAVRRFEGALSSIAELNDAASGWGLISTDEVRGTIRRLPLVASIGGTIVPGLALEMWRVAQHEAFVRMQTAGPRVVEVATGALRVGTEADGAVRVNFSRHVPDRFVSAIDVLERRVAPTRLNEQLVLVGITALALGDHRYTPSGDRMPGSEIHAQLLENLFEHSLLQRPAWAPGAEAFLLLALGAVLLWATPRASARTVSLAAAAAVVVPMAAAFILYRDQHLLLDAVTPAVFVLLLFATLLAMTLAAAYREQRALQTALQLQREENARVSGELLAARRVQMETLPRPEQIDDPRIGIAASMEPAREVGGDLYDFFRLDEHRVFFMLGDVAGKGLSASIFMAVSKALCKSTMLRAPDADIGALLSAANTEVARDNAGELFVTAFAGILDLRSGVLAYCNAGHENPFLVRHARQSAERLVEGGGPPLCVVDDFPYRGASANLQSGDLLCVVSDGITEAEDASGRFYGHSRMEEKLARSATPQEALTAILADLKRFLGAGEPADDVTLLILRWQDLPPARKLPVARSPD